jgi:hypothetical protein
MSMGVGQAEGVDRITFALQRRAERVAAQEARDEEARLLKLDLRALLSRPDVLDTDYLVGLLRATWERIPDDLSLVGWESPSTEDEDECMNEVLAIGSAVADVLAVYESREEERHEPGPHDP